GPNLRIQRPFSNVVDDADDLLHRFWTLVKVAKALANRVLTGIKLLRQCLIDDDHARLTQILRVSEHSSAQELRLQCVEILRAHSSLIYLVVFAVERATLKPDPVGVAVVGQGQYIGECD